MTTVAAVGDHRRLAGGRLEVRVACNEEVATGRAAAVPELKIPIHIHSYPSIWMVMVWYIVPVQYY